MKLLIAALLAVTISNVCGSNVLQFSVEDEERALFDLLMKPHPLVHTRLGTYRYTNCGDPKTDIGVLSNLTLGPDPLSFPGTLTVAFTATLKETVDAPLKANLVLSRQVGSSWVKIPCIGNIGSCNYDDLCALLAGATCPPIFVSAGVPCKCPFTKGNYHMPKSSIAIDAAVFPAGNYHAVGTLTYSAKRVACVDLYASFE